MGKYDDKYKEPKNEPTDVFISLMLRDIANELAEANKLKKIEIKLSYLEDLTNEDIRGFIKELDEE